MGKVMVLGTGLVGGWVADRLATDGHDVIAVDTSISALKDRNSKVTCIHGPARIELFEEYVPDVIVNALPGRIGDLIRTDLIRQGLAVADLAFTAEDPREHHESAVDTGARLVYDVGVAPGLSNLLLAEGNRRHGRLVNGRVRVGGNPVEPDDDWSYMAPFSPQDVIEEYTRPARILRDNEIVIVPAISERTLFEVERRGEMEAFLTDGLRSVLDTVDAENLTEATVRWPGHIGRFIGLGDEYDESELLKAWRWDSKRREFTWMEVIADGNGKSRWILDDEGGEQGSSMARTTGAITCATVEHLLESDVPAGVHPPEALGTSFLDRCLTHYAANGIRIVETRER